MNAIYLIIHTKEIWALICSWGGAPGFRISIFSVVICDLSFLLHCTRWPKNSYFSQLFPNIQLLWSTVYIFIMPKIFSIKLLFLHFLYEESLPRTLWVTLPFHFFICQNCWSWSSFLLFIQEVMISNLIPGTGYPKWHTGHFLQSIPANANKESHNRSHLLPSIHLLNHS